jgi:hypothetical protein
MKYRFPLYAFSHTCLAVNITGLSENVAGVKVNGSSLPYIQFTSWEKAKRRFAELGAGQEALDSTKRQLAGTGLAALTIMAQWPWERTQ